MVYFLSGLSGLGSCRVIYRIPKPFQVEKMGVFGGQIRGDVKIRCHQTQTLANGRWLDRDS